MTRSENGRSRTRIGSVLLAVVLGSVAVAGAAEPKGGPSEGIRVRGEWTIEIRNPDGSLASRHEFRNALVDEGKAWLARLLGQTTSTWGAAWNVEVGETTADGLGGPCVPSVTPPNGVPCRMRELANPPVAALTVTHSGGTVQLSGTVTAAKDAPQLSRFATYLDFFGGTTARFTEKRLPAPVPVVAGQIVTVTVVFSFSSGS